jgi:hypothetical protein
MHVRTASISKESLLAEKKLPPALDRQYSDCQLYVYLRERAVFVLKLELNLALPPPNDCT